MHSQCDMCSYERAFDVRFSGIEANIQEVKSRVTRLETVLARGMMLLVANLACVILALIQQMMN